MHDRYKEVNNESKSFRILDYCWNFAAEVLSTASDIPLKNNSRKLKIFVKNRVN